MCVCVCVCVCLVLCTSPRKYRVIDADGTIKPRCCIDMSVTIPAFTTDDDANGDSVNSGYGVNSGDADNVDG